MPGIPVKCTHCKKRHAVLVQCRCENHYCLKHRLPELHSCTYVFEPVELEKVENKKIETI
jgi:predicted nucleic acid binding AN1-type Zn finger protein